MDRYIAKCSNGCRVMVARGPASIATLLLSPKGEADTIIGLHYFQPSVSHEEPHPCSYTGTGSCFADTSMSNWSLADATTSERWRELESWV